MPKRQLRFLPNHYYHIYNRGAAQRSIFHGDRDYRHLLTLVKRFLERLDLSLLAYCLMPNHYHWLVRQNGRIPARLLPQKVWKSYANTFNHRYGRSGTLFEGRYKAKHVGNDTYLRHLCRYIHLNPVKDGVAAAPELWPYSNYLEWIGQRPGTLVDQEFIATFFGGAAAYRQDVEQEIIAAHPLPPILTYLQEGPHKEE